METQRSRLRRSRRDKMIGGVCGGIAEWMGWDASMVRLSYVLVSLLSIAFPGLLIYLILWLVTPQAED